MYSYEATFFYAFQFQNIYWLYGYFYFGTYILVTLFLFNSKSVYFKIQLSLFWEELLFRFTANGPLNSLMKVSVSDCWASVESVNLEALSIAP